MGAVKILAIGALLVLTGCTQKLEYPMPAQKAVPAGEDPPIVRPLLKMSDMDVDGFILEGITHASPGEPSRWTNQHARIRLWPDPAQPWTFAMHLQIAGEIRKAVGPQTITITLNRKVLASPRFDRDQQYDYRYRVPSEMIAAPVVVGLDVEPFWSAPDGAKLGVLLTSIGFEK